MIITEKEQTQFDVVTTCWVCGRETVDGDKNLRKVRTIATSPGSTEVRLTTSAT